MYEQAATDRARLRSPPAESREEKLEEQVQLLTQERRRTKEEIRKLEEMVDRQAELIASLRSQVV